MLVWALVKRFWYKVDRIKAFLHIVLLSASKGLQYCL